MGLLTLLFIVVPAIELALLAELGSRVGWLPTMVLVIATGITGAALARQQGFAVLARLNAETAAGRIPGATLVDGALILIAGALLVTPGILTDVVGFCLLIPPLRALLKTYLARYIEASAHSGRAFTSWSRVPRQARDPRVVDATFDDKDKKERVYEARFEDDSS